MMNQVKTWAGRLLSVAVVLMATGCAHPISLSPDFSKVTTAPVQKLERKAGLVITEQNRAREVNTPGGGGDKLSYFPYRDLEVGLYQALSQVFADVSKVSGPQDPKVKSEGLSYLVTPTINTASWSDSAFTWPPTLFTVELNCTIVDAQGQELAVVRAQGEGRAEFSEFKSDFSLSAKRASEDALKKLIQALAEASAKLR